MMIRNVAGGLLLLTLLTVANGRNDLIKLPSEARRFVGGESNAGADDDSVGTRWAVLLAGSSGYWNYRHQVIQIRPKLSEFWFI